MTKDGKSDTLLLKLFAVLCLVLSISAIADYSIREHNKRVEMDTHDLRNEANGEPHFRVYGDWGPGPRERDRFAIFMICFFGVFFSLGGAGRILTTILYAFAALFAVHWYMWIANAIRVNEIDLGNESYLFFIASFWDWLLFVSLAVILVIRTASLIRKEKGLMG